MQGIIEFLLLGGLVVQILVAFSVASLTVILLKFWQFFQQRVLKHAHPEHALKHYEKGERHQALLLMQNQKNPRARVLATALHLLDQGGLAMADVRDEVGRVAQAAIARQQQYLRVLEVIAMVAPLLGLFGTVLGMITAFQAMEHAGAQVNPAVLSGGIWKALMTTAAGLAVAIPVSLIHSWLERYVETSAQSLSDDVQRLFTLHKQQYSGESVVRKKA